MRLETAVTDVLTRLGDKETAVWTRDEIELYYKDGLDQFCRRSKCLWDIYAIENLPPVGNWQTDLEKYFAEQIPGMGLTDERMNFTAEHERGDQIGNAYPGPRRGPAAATSPGDRAFFGNFTNITTNNGKQVTGGTLPNNTVEVTRVAFDNRSLNGISSQRMREIDPNYETRAGDPQWYLFDKDGIFYLRVVPAAQGNASYDTVSGSWGTLTQRLDANSAVEDTIDEGGHGGYGILRHRTDMFPSGGPHGTPTRVHPDSANIKVEVFRLNRDPDSHEIEIPLAYQKYPIFWAMHRALERTGPGQDIQLSDHYKSRFDMGVGRMERKVRELDKERIGRLGGLRKMSEFGLGSPQPPYPYGIPF
jgi:hypothetical protein